MHRATIIKVAVKPDLLRGGDHRRRSVLLLELDVGGGDSEEMKMMCGYERVAADGQTIGQLTGESVGGQTIGQLIGEFVDGQTIGQLTG